MKTFYVICGEDNGCTVTICDGIQQVKNVIEEWAKHYNDGYNMEDYEDIDVICNELFLEQEHTYIHHGQILVISGGKPATIHLKTDVGEVKYRETTVESVGI